MLETTGLCCAADGNDVGCVWQFWLELPERSQAGYVGASAFTLWYGALVLF